MAAPESIAITEANDLPKKAVQSTRDTVSFGCQQRSQLCVVAALLSGCSASPPVTQPSAASQPVSSQIAVMVDAEPTQVTSTPLDPYVLVGSASDVHAQPGLYNGYEVYFECSRPFVSTVFVRGTGTREFPQPSDAQLLQAWNHGGYSELARERWGAEDAFWDTARSVRVAAGVRSIWQVAGVRTCKTSGWWARCAIGLFLNDWRDVDAAIVGIGSWFAREHFSGEVALRIEAKRKAILL